MLLLWGTRGEIDIDEGVELSEDDVDVVGTDARREDGYAFALVGAGGTDELTVGVFALDGVEEGLDHGDASGVSYEDDFVGELSGLYVKVEDGAVGVDDELRVGDWGVIHGVQVYVVEVL